jgi:hypothetical protein
LKVPAPAANRSGSGVKTSYWALASAALALLGAFTVLGSLAAVCLGLVALVGILRQRERLAGVGLALFGIVAGTLFTALTLVVLVKVDLSSLGSWVRQRSMAGQVDTSGPLEITTRDFTLVRPSGNWGRVKKNESDDQEVAPLQTGLDLLLVNINQHAFVDVARDPAAVDLDEVQNRQFLDLVRTKTPEDDGIDPEIEFGRPRRPETSRVSTLSRSDLPHRDGVQAREQLLEVRRGRQTWRFLVRTYQRSKDKGHTPDSVFVVRAYAPAQKFKAHEAELRKILDSFRLAQKPD